ncbi:hypothetical protein B0H15DRAFT_571486 [Mycena belliarum]|uniref:Uncharacterized protein n=1 Tax=Mycena belliarum TaxID=1033014 RepID=A0AAD6TUT8_9AGAR|nr:hypothetical protein B0H15DRAFT_571486 [Mycena belliae]
MRAQTQTAPLADWAFLAPSSTCSLIQLCAGVVCRLSILITFQGDRRPGERWSVLRTRPPLTALAGDSRGYPHIRTCYTDARWRPRYRRTPRWYPYYRRTPGSGGFFLVCQRSRSGIEVNWRADLTGVKSTEPLHRFACLHRPSSAFFSFTTT